MHSNKFTKLAFTEMRACSSLRPRPCMFDAIAHFQSCYCGRHVKMITFWDLWLLN